MDYWLFSQFFVSQRVWVSSFRSWLKPTHFPVSLSSHLSKTWWPFRIPSTPLIRMVQGLPVFNVTTQGTGQLGSVILSSSDWSLIILSSMYRICALQTPQLPSVDQVFITWVIAKALSHCWVHDFPWHYAVLMAGLWAVPGVWSFFMTSCPRAREAKLPISFSDRADRMNSELAGVLMAPTLI